MSLRVPRLTVGRALAEALVIIAGVLIALAADAALEEMDERALEATYIAALRRDVEEDLRTLDRRVEQFEQRVDDQLRLYDVARGREESVDSSAFLLDLARAANYGTFDAQTATFQDLLSTGRIRLIRDPSLRDQVLRYYKLVEDLAQVDEAHRVQVLAAYQQYLVPEIGGVGLSLAFGNNPFLSYQPESPDPTRLRQEAAQALTASSGRPLEGFRQFVVVAGSLMTKSRSGFANLRIGAENLRQALVRYETVSR